MKDEIKLFYPSQIGYRSLNARTNIARKILDSMYPKKYDETDLLNKLHECTSTELLYFMERIIEELTRRII